MPIYCYACSFCNYEFEEYFKHYEKSGRTLCPKCGNISFKIPAIFNTRIFKPRKFADGSSTPEFVNTSSQEKAWLKSQNITYDPPTGREKRHRKEEKTKKSQTVMEKAFKEAYQKVEQGYKGDNKQIKRNPKKLGFKVGDN